jgi:threonine/homoserine/homoserine lactone efflux protein
MTLELYLAFVAATTIMILLPGPSVLLTVAHAMAFGGRRALLTVAGTSTAIVLQLAVTALGMTSLLLVLSEWFEVLRWAGVAYLVYLARIIHGAAWKMLVSVD